MLKKMEKIETEIYLDMKYPVEICIGFMRVKCGSHEVSDACILETTLVILKKLTIFNSKSHMKMA